MTKAHDGLVKAVRQYLKDQDLEALKTYMDGPYEKPDAEDVVKLFSDAVNYFGCGKSFHEEFTAQFCNQHRTLQQSMMKVFISFMMEVADKQDYCFDGRNENMHKFCKFVKDSVKRYEEEHPEEASPSWMPFI